MPRPLRHRYRDPLDHVWLDAAARIGLRVERSPEAFAHADGRGRLILATGEHLDPDDCLAQMIFHELCHSLVEGEDSFRRADWGLDNTGPEDDWREHACLRVQATLAGRHGLRRVLAPTTDFRAFYDALPDDPLEPGRDPSSERARLALRRAYTPPWAPHLERALSATAAIASVAARFSLRERELASLWSAVEAPPPAHPTGLPPRQAGDRTCGDCAWRDPASRLCRQAEQVVAPDERACERFEAPFDCQDCGACCRAAYHAVAVEPDDPAATRLGALIARRKDGGLEVARAGDRCAALAGGVAPGERFACTVYDDRPRCCREFERGGEHCLVARRRVGLSL